MSSGRNWYFPAPSFPSDLVKMVDYKLRLGDGTTFSVDEKGLTTWLQGGLVDDKARIQPAGSKKWFTLKQVLAAQGEQRGHAVRQTDQGRADVDRQAAVEVAAIERRVAEQRAAEERKAAEELANAERKAAQQRTAAERKAIEEREAAERYAAEEAAEAEARAAAERQAEQDRLDAERRAAEEERRAADEEARAAEERMAAESAEAMAREAARIAEAEAKVAAERAERAERKRKAEDARAEAERQAAEAARLEAERVAAEAARVAAAEKAVAAERAERAERKRRAEEERIAAERQAAEKAAAAKAAAERAAAEKATAARAAAEREVAVAAFHAEDPVVPPAIGMDVEPAPAMVKVEEFERELALVPVGFDESAESAARDRITAPSPSANPAAELSAEAAAATPKTAAAVLHGLVGGLKLIDRAVTSVAGIFGSRSADATATPTQPAPVASSAPAVSPAPAPYVAPAKSAPPRAAATPAGTAPQTAPPPWAAPPPAPWTPQASATIPVKASPAAPPRPPATPPPSYQKLDVIPFATAPPAPRVTQDVWDGEREQEEVWQEPGRFSSALGNVWRWTKRAMLATVLIGGAVILALNKDKWIPQAQDAATALGQGVDKLSERASTRTVSPRAIEDAREQIPYLRPATIQLILSRSPVDLEPAEVFRRAHEAAERARPSLPTNVAAEIDNLTNAVAAGLDAGEAQHLRTYLGLLRAGTPTAAYQDKEAIWLMARGVRRLSGEQRARMEELFAQAIAVALQPPPS